MSKKTKINNSSGKLDLTHQEYEKKLLEKISLETNIEKKKIYEDELYDYYIKNNDIFNEYYTNNNKKDILIKYKEINKIDDYHNIITYDINICYNCNIYKELCNENSILICPYCFEETEILIEPEKPSYKDPPKENNYYLYIRHEHLRDHLEKIQAKENKKIPKEVIAIIYVEYDKENNNNLANLTIKKICTYLKKYKHLGYHKYCENAIQILNIITGIKLIDIPPEREEKILEKFIIIEKAFNDYKNSNSIDRDNLISYPSLIYKICQILEYNEYLPHLLKLIKIGTKYKDQNTIWKGICKYADPSLFDN